MQKLPRCCQSLFCPGTQWPPTVCQTASVNDHDGAKAGSVPSAISMYICSRQNIQQFMTRFLKDGDVFNQQRWTWLPDVWCAAKPKAVIQASRPGMVVSNLGWLQPQQYTEMCTNASPDMKHLSVSEAVVSCQQPSRWWPVCGYN